MVTINKHTEITIHAVLLLALGAVLLLKFNNGQSVGADQSFNSQLVGLEIPSGYLPDGRDHKLLFIVSPTCIYCGRSLPFYSELSKQKKNGAFEASLVIAVDSSLTEPLLLEQRRMLTENNVSHDRLIRMGLGRLGILSTPTVLLVGGDNTVEEAWIGLMDDKMMNDIVHRVSNPNPNAL